ncbi:hypothetical protein V5O48_011996 [Marasmius crinis-equi]|uniref:Uncharacterized protein n=1 Tax=Marasmius crinis-equi TaxID=585013 RepID=A0ABR3F445_9AGAR
MSLPLKPSDVGQTIAKGIQDIAALLPLLGTEQCERHVGAALESGYIYAAATPLSIFGSLGIVKAAFATYLASVTKGFHGGKWFHNAGFGTVASGSVIPLVTIVSGTKQYGAELKLQELLREQHLNDPELVSGVKFFGWKKKTRDEEYSPLTSKFSFSWTFALVLASALFSTISFTPYLYLTHDRWDQPISWLFPALRSIGSMLCVISVQCALQLRIHRIVNSSLLLLKSRKDYPPKEINSDMQKLMETRLQKLREKLKKDISDPERGEINDTKRGQLEEVEKVLCLDFALLIHQALLLAGMMMIVTGYVGCFNLVNRSDVKNGPYIWLAMETSLSILRMALWGWNPSWAQGDTGLELELKLQSKEGASHNKCARSTETRTAIFPPITTSRSLSQLKPKQTPEPTNFFIAVSAEDFLAAATPYVGPLHRLQLDGISLFHAIVPEEVEGIVKRKLLCLTIRRDDSEGATLSLFIRSYSNPTNTESYKLFSSQSSHMRGSQTRSLQITLEDEFTPPVLDKRALIDPATFQLLLQYSSTLFRRLFIDRPSLSIRPLWTLVLPLPPTPKGANGDVALTELDKKYIGLREADDKLRREVESTLPLPKHPQLAEMEYAIIFKVAILEIRLCVKDYRFAESTGLSSDAFRPLAGEWIRRMEGQIFTSKKGRTKRLKDDECTDAEQTWRSLFRELRLLRRLSANSSVLEKWEQHIHAMDAGKIVPLSELFELAPFRPGLPHLRKHLHVFTDNDASTHNDLVQSHREIKSFILSAMRAPGAGQLAHSCGDSRTCDNMELFPPRNKLPREYSTNTLVETEPLKNQVQPTPKRVSPVGGRQILDAYMVQTPALVQIEHKNLKANVESSEYFLNNVHVVNQ